MPVEVADITTASGISTNVVSSCAIVDYGAVDCWGSDENGLLGNGQEAGTETCNFTSCDATPVKVLGISNATDVSVGREHACAVLADESVACWGKNGSGQLGDGTTAGPERCQFEIFSCSKAPVSVIGITDAIKVVAGIEGYSCALLKTGHIDCWGYNGAGELGDATTTDSDVPVEVRGITNATSLAAGTSPCAVLAGGRIECWGFNEEGQLGDGTSTGPERCHEGQWPCSTTPIEVSGVTNATAVSSGLEHACAVLADGSVECWGANEDGQLGIGNNTIPTECEGRVCSTTPVPVKFIGAVKAIAAGDQHTCVLLAAGGVDCWGLDESGQVGNGTLGGSAVSPETVAGLP